MYPWYDTPSRKYGFQYQTFLPITISNDVYVTKLMALLFWFANHSVVIDAKWISCSKTRVRCPKHYIGYELSATQLIW